MCVKQKSLFSFAFKRWVQFRYTFIKVYTAKKMTTESEEAPAPVAEPTQDEKEM